MLETAFARGESEVTITLNTDSICASDVGGGRQACIYKISLTPGAFTQTNTLTGYQRPVKRARESDFELSPWSYLKSAPRQSVRALEGGVAEEALVFDIPVAAEEPVVADYLRKKVEVENDEKDSLLRQLESLSVISVSGGVTAGGGGNIQTLGKGDAVSTSRERDGSVGTWISFKEGFEGGTEMTDVPPIASMRERPNKTSSLQDDTCTDDSDPFRFQPFACPVSNRRCRMQLLLHSDATD